MEKPPTDLDLIMIKPSIMTELETMGLFQKTRGGIEAVEKRHCQDALLENVRAGQAAA